MKVSIVVTTYNWESALNSVLRSIAQQTVLPYEVIVADDGSKQSTQAMVIDIAKNYPVALKHSWQEDRGFRLARSRNLAIAAATGDYIIILDGDMVVNKHFVEDHVHAAKVGFYVQGSRILTQPQFDADKLLLEQKDPHYFSKGIARRRHTIRMPWLSNIFLNISEGQKTTGVKGCNQGWWRKDLISVNGYDERFVGWGREDNDILLRAYRMGLKRRDIRFAALATHIYHNERHPDGVNPNDRWLKDNTERQVIMCEAGLDQHLDHFKKNPLPGLREPAASY